MKIFYCEQCGKEHNGSYGSGRFCSDHCRRVYSAKKVKHRVNNLPIKKVKDGGWKCPYCEKIFHTRREKQMHVKEVHPERIGIAWNKGLTKESNAIVKQAAETLKYKYDTYKIIPFWKGHSHSEYTKRLISEKMKKAHAEGRAHNIGQSRWNNKPSYPEQWFMNVINNEFINKDYIREKSFGRFSLDFAWNDLKKCIEIDGEQHERFEDQKKRDRAKDKLLKESKWEILRIPWKNMFNNTKKYIKKAKNFIDGK